MCFILFGWTFFLDCTDFSFLAQLDVPSRTVGQAYQIFQKVLPRVSFCQKKIVPGNIVQE